MNFEEAKEYLLNIPRFTGKNEPDKTRAFLEEIGDFTVDVPTIHVAGTNGKGSVCAFLRAGLENAGFKVAMFTSPHLVNITERFQIGHEEMTTHEFLNTFEYVLELTHELNRREGFEKYHPSFFEFLFFMFAVWVREKKPDVIILEVGLGGRLDATNSISNPAVSVITEIGLDHCEYLGNTKELIAGEKAGIIKQGVPVVHFSKGQAFDDVIALKARQKNAPYISVSRENIKNLESTPSGIDFSIQSLYDESIKISLNTKALFQVENAAVAYKALEILSGKLSELDIEKCREGFFAMSWPGRMETVREGFVIDGAHNEDGIKAFIETVKGDSFCNRSLLYSAVSDKDIENVTRVLIESGLFSRYYVCVLDSYRAASMERLKDAFKEAKSCSFHKTVKEALKEMLSDDTADIKYAAGSLYLVGEIKELIKEETEDD